VALVWQAGKREAAALRSFAAILPDLPADARTQAEALDIPWRDHLWKPHGHRVSPWRLLILDRP
jgi:hypothetical protein